jgi:hypothetical protein
MLFGRSYGEAGAASPVVPFRHQRHVRKTMDDQTSNNESETWPAKPSWLFVLFTLAVFVVFVFVVWLFNWLEARTLSNE